MFDTSSGSRKSLGTAFADVGVGCVKFATSRSVRPTERSRSDVGSCHLGVTVSPDIIHLDYSQTQAFTVSVAPLSSSARLTYRWNVSSSSYYRLPGSGHIQDPVSGAQDDFVTTASTVVYTAPTFATFAFIIIDAFDNSTGTPVQVGTAIATLSVGCDSYSGTTRIVCLP